MIIQQMKPLLTTLLLPMLAFHVLGQSPSSTTALTDEETAKILADITKVQREFVKTKKEVLAGALSKVELGDEIPAELYKAVAEVLIFVLRLSGRVRYGGRVDAATDAG